MWTILKLKMNIREKIGKKVNKFYHEKAYFENLFFLVCFNIILKIKLDWFML